ncbi:ribonuclease III [Paracidobacterium acidisoli]|uniref:Ribonuclease 3 n=1 Tax=Paracidobacterium acidisoli TaxID=2303751 RepID=A0A372IPU2_9BACT|nr:ribonuclease III [Paracidobacterium acidisoli]MBT9332125.1 ribonuclease III [Paracidobacterium acidisoli]
METSAPDDLEALLGHVFHQRALLIRALTHSSLAHERGTPAPGEDNEQLEFLGDAVVGLLVAESLFRSYPDLREGELTRLRAALVSRRHLGQVAARLDLGKFLLLGRGEERSGGRKKNALLANTMEAVIGALYLDAGIETARSFVEQNVIAPSVSGLYEQLAQGISIGDHKSALQELLQAKKQGQPEYVVKGESGPDHRKEFLVEVRIAKNGGRAKALARGAGTTRKLAEQEAARRAMEKLAAAAQEDGE